jgi:hypothetical protein
LVVAVSEDAGSSALRQKSAHARHYFGLVRTRDRRHDKPELLQRALRRAERLLEMHDVCF